MQEASSRDGRSASVPGGTTDEARRGRVGGEGEVGGGCRAPGFAREAGTHSEEATRGGDSCAREAGGKQEEGVSETKGGGLREAFPKESEHPSGDRFKTRECLGMSSVLPFFFASLEVF